MRLGCIADDFTGATDLASNLSAAGMRVVMTNGIPDTDAVVHADALVVALKSRTAPPREAVMQSVAACRALKSRGASQIYFKICSTFDSTAQGNIGNVLEALMRELGCAFSIVAPAFPGNGRTVRHGSLYVNGVPLSETSMRNHPLTPMTDSNLQALLLAQLRCASVVGLINEETIRQGASAIRGRIRDLTAAKVAVAIADSADDRDLATLAQVLSEDPLVTASSGLGAALPACRGFHPSAHNAYLPSSSGHAVMLAGSCSTMSRRQVAAYRSSGGAAFALDLDSLLENQARTVAASIDFARERYAKLPHSPVMIYSTSETPGTVPEAISGEAAGRIVEQAFAAIAQQLKNLGVRRWIVAGGETSGAVIQALGVKQLQVGSEIDLGVPWCWTEADGVVMLFALKSGNFGGQDFFQKSLRILQEESQ